MFDQFTYTHNFIMIILIKKTLFMNLLKVLKDHKSHTYKAKIDKSYTEIMQWLPKFKHIFIVDKDNDC